MIAMGSSTSPKRSRLFVMSLDRGLTVLEALARHGIPLTLTELAAAAGLNKVTANRFCHTLVELGYIEKSPTKRYQLTPRILNLGYAVLCSFDLCQLGEPYLRALSKSLGETVNMAVLEGTEILYVSRFKTEQILATELHIGSKLPVYCTSMGKAMLAHLPREEQAEILDRLSFASLTHHTIENREQLEAELREVQARRYAINDEELSVGLRSIAAPVVRGGRVVAAVNVAVPTSRFDRQALVAQVSAPLLATAAAISKALDQQVGGRRAV
jgi:IclR family pca regulon transcriptional regulator